MTKSTARWIVLGIAGLLLLVQPASARAACSCPAVDAAGFPLGASDPGPPLFCSYPAFPGGDPNQFFCLYDASSGGLIEDHNDESCPSAAVGCGGPPPVCEAHGILTLTPAVKVTPSTKPGGVVWKGTLTGCTNFESFAGAKFPISDGSFTLSIKSMLPGAWCSSMLTDMGPKTKSKLTFKFTGINPKTGKPAAATRATSVEVASVSPDLFGHTIVSLVIADPKSPFDGRTAKLILTYDESGFEYNTMCESKKGLSKLHFGTILDKGVQWLPFNGPSSFALE